MMSSQKISNQKQQQQQNAKERKRKSKTNKEDCVLFLLSFPHRIVAVPFPPLLCDSLGSKSLSGQIWATQDEICGLAGDLSSSIGADLDWHCLIRSFGWTL